MFVARTTVEDRLQVASGAVVGTFPENIGIGVSIVTRGPLCEATNLLQAYVEDPVSDVNGLSAYCLERTGMNSCLLGIVTTRGHRFLVLRYPGSCTCGFRLPYLVDALPPMENLFLPNLPVVPSMVGMSITVK